MKHHQAPEIFQKPIATIRDFEKEAHDRDAGIPAFHGVPRTVCKFVADEGRGGDVAVTECIRQGLSVLTIRPAGVPQQEAERVKQLFTRLEKARNDTGGSCRASPSSIASHAITAAVSSC